MKTPGSGLRDELRLLLVAGGVKPLGTRPSSLPSPSQGGHAPQERRPLVTGGEAGLHHSEDQRADDVPWPVQHSEYQTLELDTQGHAEDRSLGTGGSSSNEGASPATDGSLRSHGE